MNNNECCKETNYDFPRTLSREASNEILGDNLCFLFAIGLDGQVVRYFPYGVEVPKNFFELQGSHEQIKPLLECLIGVAPVDTTDIECHICKRAFQYFCTCQSAGGPRRC